MKVEFDIPEDVEVSVSDRAVEVKGPLGELKKDFSFIPLVKFSIDGKTFTIDTERDRKTEKRLSHSARAHIQNMFEGVTKGFRYKLAIVNVHFPMRLSVRGDALVLDNFLGSKTSLEGKKYSDVEVKVKDKEVIVEGLDKDHVGQTAANIEKLTRVKDKDRRVFKDGIFLIERGNINE